MLPEVQSEARSTGYTGTRSSDGIEAMAQCPLWPKTRYTVTVSPKFYGDTGTEGRFDPVH